MSQHLGTVGERLFLSLFCRPWNHNNNKLRMENILIYLSVFMFFKSYLLKCHFPVACIQNIWVLNIDFESSSVTKILYSESLYVLLDFFPTQLCHLQAVSFRYSFSNLNIFWSFYFIALARTSSAIECKGWWWASCFIPSLWGKFVIFYQ